MSPLFFSHVLFKSILFPALASSFFFSPVLPAACSSCSPLLARTRGPVHDPPLPPLLAVHARSHHAACVMQPPRPLLLAVPLCACCPCTPSRRATHCCADPSPSCPLALVACALSPGIPAAINGEVPVLPVTLPCRPSPLFLSAYKSAPEQPLTPHRPSTSPPLPRTATCRRRSLLPATTHLHGQPSVDRLRTR
jgi:hypothetical protein